MKKLGKKINTMEESVEAYCLGTSNCVCYCMSCTDMNSSWQQTYLSSNNAGSAHFYAYVDKD